MACLRLVSVIVRFQVAGGPPALAGPRVRPESNPPTRGSHGFSNDDCATAWLEFGLSKTKVITVPIEAVGELGENRNPFSPFPLPPTWI